jgi:hypothetical protein
MTWYECTVPLFHATDNLRNFPRWPSPNGPRVDAKFRFVGSAESCDARGSRHFVWFNPFGAGGPDHFALIDVLPIGVGHLQGETNVDADGRVLRLDIVDYDLSNPHPEYSETGIEYDYTLSLPGKFDWHTRWFWPNPPVDGFGPPPRNITIDPFANPPARTVVDPWVVGSAWENDSEGSFFWHTWDECRDICGGEKEIGEPFARFNGTNAYIALTVDAAAFNNPFVVHCDFRYQGQLDWAPIWGRHAAGGFFGFDEHEVIFGNLRLNTSWVPVVGVWYKYEYRFEQSGQLGHQQLIDDVIVMDAVTNRQFINANRLGVYRHTVPGTIWGHFDLRNLKYLKGVTPNFTTELDMPLTTNCLDLGPRANHGTSFNMLLPSV